MVHFVGAGPGAPDLITRRGAALLQTADCIIYAGSLVNPALLGLAKAGCAIYNSAEMTLEQVLAVMRQMEAEHKTTVRLHTGDPCLYGAIREQKTVRCTVGTLAQSTKQAGITKTALIVVGDFLGRCYARSKLYDPAFTTEYREGTKP